MATIDRLSKPSTVYLSLPAGAGVAALATDAGQYRTDLTAAATYARELASARAALTYPRAVSVVVDLNRDDEGTLVDHGNGAGGSSFRLYLAGSGLIQCYEAASIRVSGTLPGIDGVTRRYLIHWASRLEGSAVKTELLLVNLGSSAVVYAAASHTAGTTSAAYNLAVNANGAGGNSNVAASRYRTVRIDRRFVTCVEAWEDFIAETTPPSMTQVRRAAPLVPDRATLDVADDGALVGPAHLWAGATFRDCDRRLVGPLVNVRVPSPYAITMSYAPAAWHRLAPGSATLRICTALAFYQPIPRKVTRARVRLFVRQNCDVDTETAVVRYRMYSIAGLLGPQPLTYHRTGETTCSTDHGATGGEWLDLGALRLAPDDWGCTLLAVAYEIDADDPLADDTEAYVHAVTVEPYAEEADGDALPFNLSP